jgi:hypothetical protein|tara:strand:- start:461 stop:874 length:414 start_codon:yes stop_codon:yes gene_type:complete
VTEIVENDSSDLHFWLIIKLMWRKSNKEIIYHNRSLERMLWKLLQPEKITWITDYYIECLIDTWHYNDYNNDDDLVSLNILETVILKEHKYTYSYGALIKAVSYLLDYPEKDYNRILDKARKTKMYQEDETYREWID